MTVGKLVLVTGPATVGKSTVAKALQSELARSGELCLAVDLTAFTRAVPLEWFSLGTPGTRQGQYAGLGFTYEPAKDGSIELTLGSDGRRVFSAFQRSTAAIVKSGVNTVCETIVYDDDDWRNWSEALSGIPACWVKLTAPLATLEDREMADRTRVLRGLAKGMSAKPPVGIYDIEADTSSESSREIVQRVIKLLSA